MVFRFLSFSSLCFIVLNSYATGYNTSPEQAAFQNQTLNYHLESAQLRSTKTQNSLLLSLAFASDKTTTENKLVFLLGGGPGFSSWNLQPIQKQIASWGYDVVLMDMAGIGENRHLFDASSENIKRNILDVWVEQLFTVQQKLGFNRESILVGHSWGALMAMLYLRKHPQTVSDVVLLNPVDPEKKSMQNLTHEIDLRNRSEQGRSWDDESNWDQKTEIQSHELDRITLNQIKQVLPTYFLDYNQGVNYAIHFGLDDFNIDLNSKAWKAYDENPVTYSELKQLDKPFYFLECKQDYLMPYNHLAFIANIDLADTVLLDGCGHFPWVEKPTQFYSSLKRFLQQAKQ